MRKVILTAVVLLCLASALGWMRGWHAYTQAGVRAAPLKVSHQSGQATVYYLCDGSNGACAAFGKPCDGAKLHAAWPHLDITDCHLYCPGKYVSSLNCGDKIMVSDHCPYGYRVEVEVRDCCACNGPGGCDDWSRCDGSYWSIDDVIIDLTPTAFYSLHGSTSDGRIPAGVYYNY